MAEPYARSTAWRDGSGQGHADSVGPVPDNVTDNVSVLIAGEATTALVDAFARLIPQLSRSSPPPTQPELAEMIESPAVDVLVAVDGDGPAGDVLGALTLVVFRIPTGVRAWIED